MTDTQNHGRLATDQLEQERRDQRWREAALCAQTDPEIFYPAKGGSTSAARRVCAACPVRAECLADALAHHDTDFGVRTGTTPRQRRALLRARTAHGRAA